MPKLLTTPFASAAATEYRTDIQRSIGENSNSATYEYGFPPETMRKVSEGGLPPKGPDFNGVLYDITDNIVNLTKGIQYGFNADYAAAIGGYPEGAILRLNNGVEVISTIENNTIDPNLDMTGWVSNTVQKGATIQTFNTPEAGVDPVVGVAEGAYFNVRSSSDESYIDEYRNVSGSAVATGKRYLSAYGVEQQEKPASKIKDTSGLSQQEINDARVVAVDSIADLLALPEGQRKEGLRYLVKGYHVGTDVGGGEFYFDPARIGDNDEGTVLQGFVRLPASYIDAFAFGGSAYSGDPLRALQAMVDYVTPNGTISTNGWVGILEFDSQLHIYKPLKAISISDVQLRLKDQSTLFHSGSGGVPVIRITSPYVSLIGFNLDLNKLNNYREQNGVRSYMSPSQLQPIHVNESGQAPGSIHDVLISGNKLYGCPVYGIGVSGAYSQDNAGPIMPKQYDPTDFCRNITVTGNYIEGGCRSGIYFINGVVESKIIGNYSRNWMWTSFRLYNNCADCEVSDNMSVIDYDDIDISEYGDSRASNVDKALLVGSVRIGHATNNPASVRSARVVRNKAEFKGRVELDRIGLTYGIKVEWGVQDVLVDDNRVLNSADYSGIIMGSPNRFFAVRADSIEGVTIKGNDLRLVGLSEPVAGLSGVSVACQGVRDSGRAEVVISDNQIHGFTDSINFDSVNVSAAFGSSLTETVEGNTVDCLRHFIISGSNGDVVSRFLDNTIKLRETVIEVIYVYGTRRLVDVRRNYVDASSVDAGIKLFRGSSATDNIVYRQNIAVGLQSDDSNSVLISKIDATNVSLGDNLYFT